MVGYLFNDPLEDTEIVDIVALLHSVIRYLFNDPLEDTEIISNGYLYVGGSLLLVQRSVRGY